MTPQMRQAKNKLLKQVSEFPHVMGIGWTESRTKLRVHVGRHINKTWRALIPDEVDGFEVVVTYER